MKQYLSLTTFFCDALKRWIPQGAMLFRFYEVSRLVIKGAPDSSKDQYNTPVVNWEWTEVKEVTWFDTICNNTTLFAFVQNWPENIVGEIGGGAGVQGADGPQGIDGVQGGVGPQGVDGAAAFRGFQGFDGMQGDVGPQGLTGAGVQGAVGVQGVAGTNGTNGVQGNVGPQGLTGNAGVQGVAGTTGFQGVAGSNGTNGVQGSIGPQGLTGSGVQGVAGADGADGFQGVAGANGTNGVQGSIGPQGLTGSGVQGAAGADGANGVQGFTGADGAIGPQGLTGSGVQGDMGPQGFQGSGTGTALQMYQTDATAGNETWVTATGVGITSVTGANGSGLLTFTVPTGIHVLSATMRFRSTLRDGTNAVAVVYGDNGYTGMNVDETTRRPPLVNMWNMAVGSGTTPAFTTTLLSPGSGPYDRIKINNVPAAGATVALAF
jgi:hypothetical protein